MPLQDKNARGFTLVEVLLSLALTAVILVILFAGLRLAQRSTEKAERRLEDTITARLLVDRIGGLVRSAYPYMGLVDDKKRALLFVGESDRMGFVTTDTIGGSPGPARRMGLRWIDLYVEGDELRAAENLPFVENVSEAEPAGQWILARDVDDVSFEYYARDPDDDKGEWIDSWDAEDHKNRMPGAVRITVRLAETDNRRTDTYVFRLPAGGPPPPR